jgi:hypothetical protein
VWTFNQHSFVYVHEKLKEVNLFSKFVHSTTNNIKWLVSFIDVIFEWMTPAAIEWTLLLDHPFDWISCLVD